MDGVTKRIGSFKPDDFSSKKKALVIAITYLNPEYITKFSQN